MSTWQATKDPRIKKRASTYWARFMKRGQHVQKSLETASFDTAKRMVENIEQDILLGVNWRRANELFETAWPDFLIDKAKGIKTKLARPKTLKEYIGFGERYFLPHLSNITLSDLESGWSQMVEDVRKEKPNMHFDNLRKYMMGFATWAYRKGKIRTKPEFYDPDIERKADREKDGPGLAYSIEELTTMRQKAKDLSPRFHLFVLMCQYMGMRPSEITQLKKDRIDIGDNLIRLRKADTKTASFREIPIHRSVRPLLILQMETSEGLSDFLFPNGHDRKRPMDPTGFKKYWNEIRAKSGRAYDFRHTFITHALEQGLNPVMVAKMTGTSLAMIEKRYSHFSADSMNRELQRFNLLPK